jgi:hypothetical protein
MRCTGSSFQQLFSGGFPSWGENVAVGHFVISKHPSIFVTANKEVLSNPWGGYKVMVSTGTSFQQLYTGGFPSWGEIVKTGKFNGDSQTDIICYANKALGIQWDGCKIYCINELPFSMPLYKAPLFPSWGESFMPGDFNGDGYSEYLVSSNSLIQTNKWDGWEIYRSR